MRIGTGMKALDTLLFGSPFDADTLNGRNRGFAPGDVVLIRGEPGSGKTTLALQIASNIYRQKRQRLIRYVALEESLEKENRRSSFEFCGNEFMLDVDWVGRKELEGELDNWRLTSADPATLTEAAAAALKAAKLPVAHGAESLAAAAAVLVKPALRGLFGLLTRAIKKKRQKAPKVPTLLVIDSLGALMNILTNAFPKEKPRLLFNEFCRHLRNPHGEGGLEEKPPSPIIVIIGEHHFADQQVDKFFPESYFCDVEIVLRPEPVRMPRDASAADKISLGYHLAAVVEPDAKHVETRSFCRVVKSRYSRNQSRRCAYDIEPRRGIRFFETYPGDGKLMLFAENEQQRAAWGSFFQRDLTDAYPALRHETFTMAGLETVYESSRRLLQMPLRTDMLLSSLDSYWVLGYRDYRLKTRINENVVRQIQRVRGEAWATTLGAVEGGRSPQSSLACGQYPHFINALVHFAMCRLNKHLFQHTLAELGLRPRSTRKRAQQGHEKRVRDLREDIGKLEEELIALDADICERFDWLSRYLLGVSAQSILHAGDRPRRPGRAGRPEDEILPRRDLRETFLCPLPRSAIMLFGQYNADLLPFLAREDMHQYENGEDHWLCIPYDANIGIFVTRADRLESVLNGLDEDAYRRAYQALKSEEAAVLREALDHVEQLMPGVSEIERRAVRRALDDALQACAAQVDARLPMPSFAGVVDARERLTWDQVICLCKVANQAVGIETRNFDTLMAMFLELVWNCGGTFEVTGRYQVRNKAAQLVPLLRALHYFRALFSVANTQTYQTIDSSHFQERSNAKPGRYGDWLFGRFWYSTLVDALTATHRPAGRGEFVWWGTEDDKKVRVEIVQMPRGDDKVRYHYACAGEWSFALLAGSENVALACDLISNLMGSLKVTQRGLQGACLPTVNLFYRRYEGERCIPATIRPDMQLPKMTFGELGLHYMGVNQDRRKSRAKGIFRQSIFDYRHCAREIFGELLRLKNVATTGAGGGDAPPEQEIDAGEGEGGDPNAPVAGPVVSAAINMLRGIEDLGGRYIFIREPFRQDVAVVSQLGVDGREVWQNGKWREVRIDVGGAKAQLDEEPLPLVNISVTGCCFKTGEQARVVGSPVRVKVGENDCTGSVTRCEQGRTAIRFDVPCDHGTFGAMVGALSPPPA